MSTNSSEEFDVVIIDNTSSRAEAMANSFASAGCTVLRFLDDDGRRRSTIKTDKPIRCLIKLWHFGDLEQKQPVVAATLIVYYGGHGGLDPRAKPTEGGERIWRRVGSKDNALNENEAKELVAYARDILKGTQPRPPKPAFLTLPQKVYALSTLAVLCKGYLAVHAAADAMKEHGLAIDFEMSDIKKALEEMGWDELQKDREALQNIIAGLSDHLLLVRSSEWWSKPCLGGDIGDSSSSQARLEKFAGVAKEEWMQIHGLGKRLSSEGDEAASKVEQSFKAVQVLLDAINDKQRKAILPAVVANGYLALSQVLKSKGRI